MSALRKLLSSILLTSLSLNFVTWFPNVSAQEATNTKLTQHAKTPEGLSFHLSQAIEQPESQPTPNLARSTDLAESETERILKRLPPISIESDDSLEFKKRETSVPPPRTARTLNVQFPQPTESLQSDEAAKGNLQVLRYAPEGDVPFAPHLSVTFSQPMIVINSQEEVAKNVPVKLEPQPPGKWRWVGTRTLLFEPQGRFPMATQYKVTVPAGIRSATAGTLMAAKTWTFETPAPTVKRTHPSPKSTQRRDPLIFVEFDQRVDPVTVLENITVRAANRQFETRMATIEETKADHDVRKLTDSSKPGHWVSFRLVDKRNDNLLLPPDSEIKISLRTGIFSAEGPLKSEHPHELVFRTFPPLRVLKHSCGDSRRCSPSDQFLINFNNLLNAASFDESKLKIEPQVANLDTQVFATTLSITGSFPARTTVNVTLDNSIKDLFGQSLNEATTLRFTVGPADQDLYWSGGNLVILDPFGPPNFSVYSINHQAFRVRVYSVTPADWPAWAKYRRERGDEGEPRTIPPGKRVVSRTIQVESKPDEMVQTGIDLGPVFTKGAGHAILIVEPMKKQKPRRYYGEPDELESWIQRTELGVDAFVDNTDLVAWATSLKTGSPLKDVEFSLLPNNLAARTDANGLARLRLKATSNVGSDDILVARLGKDSAILPEDSEYFSGGREWYLKQTSDSLRWFVFDDRGLYRPGEEVHVKGWLRRIHQSKGGDIGLSTPTNVSYVVKDQRGNESLKGVVNVNALGGFDFRLTLPTNMNLGVSQVQFKALTGSAKLMDSEFVHSFRVAEFRRPDFEVKTDLRAPEPAIVGGHTFVNVKASYFAGGGLANAPVFWQVTSTPAEFTPPNRGDFTFGKWLPWWKETHAYGKSHTKTLSGHTDSSGNHSLRIDFDSVSPPRPATLIAEARVSDVNRQTWSSTTTILVHPAKLYVGLKSDRTFVEKGELLKVQTIVTDMEGTAVPNRKVNVRAVRLDWKQSDGEWIEVEADPQDCSIESGNEAKTCTFKPQQGGQYRVTAQVRDDLGSPNESELTLWVAGGEQYLSKNLGSDELELIPNQKDYRAGEVAEVLVRAPFYPAEAVMTLQRSGIVRTEHFHLDGPTYTLRLPFEEAWTPNIHLRVDLVGVTQREIPSGQVSALMPVPKRPAFASGELNLSIPPLSRMLKVSASPRDKKLEPGSKTIVDVEAIDGLGRGVSESEVAVVVVDEAILALTRYKLADPVATFYQKRVGGVTNYHSREQVVLATIPGEAFDVNSGGGPGGAGFGYSLMTFGTGKVPPLRKGVLTVTGASEPGTAGSSDEPPIRLREDFRPLAVFAPSVRTDTNGRAHVEVQLPDNLTRYRVMAVAVAGEKQFGSGESAITARLPLMVRASAPRFLNFGDRAELPIVVQNQTDDSMPVEIAVRASNARLDHYDLKQSSHVASSSPQPRGVAAGRRVVVPANDRVEVRIPMSTVSAGVARFQIGAVSGRWSDAAEIALPVWTPATTEAFATYGEIDQGTITQPVRAPAEVFSQFGGLEIETSSTQLQQLTDAFLYLQSYPFECAEQLASRVLSVAALRDVLTAFKAKELPSPEALEDAVLRDLKRLEGMQNGDGGFGFWKRGERSWPYLSIHVAHALAIAKQKKLPVPTGMFEQSKLYLRGIDFRIPSDEYGTDARRALIAYALYVRAQMGDPDPAWARRLISELRLENLSPESLGWLLSVLSGDPASTVQAAAIRRVLNNRAIETAATAHFVCSYKDDDYLLLNSERRADSVVLQALIGDQPNSDLIPKIVRGLLAHRSQGRWANTQENVFILLALDKYFKTYEKVTPDFVAQLWLGNAYAGEQRFSGYSTDRHRLNVPMSYLTEKAGVQNLIVNKQGAGRLYYRLAMNYAPLNLDLEAADYGFAVKRKYEAVDYSEDVQRDADGSWHIKAGARVRVRVTMATHSRRYHVALVDHLPAGFETLNPDLAATESIPEEKKQEALVSFRNPFRGFVWWLWRPVWFDHQNLRDERVEAFTSLLWEGVYDYSYVARATTPGLFVVPPSKAEEMYHPETFGRSASDRVRIQ